MTARAAAIDDLRTFVIGLVLAFHASLAYATFARFDRTPESLSAIPIVDNESWLGFDYFVLFNAIFFMALMFFLSGLFVWPSLARKGSGRFLRERSLRLGLPFALVVTFVMPLAHYPAFRLLGGDTGYLEFWWRTLSRGPWPGGPAWFLWLLLIFDCVAALTWRFAHAWGDALGRLSVGTARRPIAYFGVLVAVSALAYIPLAIAFGPARWFVLGPFQIQVSRVLLYAVYFFAGVGVGAGGIERGLLASDGALARRWGRWVGAALACFALMVTLLSLRLSGRIGWSYPAWQGLYGLGFALCCAATGFGFIALFRRFGNRRRSALDGLNQNSYGIYLIHYPFVLWLQYALVGIAIPAVAKAALVFSGTAVLSWAVIAALRRIPAVARVI